MDELEVTEDIYTPPPTLREQFDEMQKNRQAWDYIAKLRHELESGYFGLSHLVNRNASDLRAFKDRIVELQKKYKLLEQERSSLSAIVTEMQRKVISCEAKEETTRKKIEDLETRLDKMSEWVKNNMK